MAQYQSGAQTRRVAELNAAAPGPFVELHPRLAARLGAAEGDELAVVSRRAERWHRPASPLGIRPDTVFMPFHWPGAGLRQHADQPGPGPDLADAGVQRCARCGSKPYGPADPKPYGPIGAKPYGPAEGRRQQVRPTYQAPSTSPASPIQVTPGPTHMVLLGPQSSISMTIREPSFVQWL
ncbi:hypothetical protein SALBM135S_06364 [Streptomyces alboniger]